MGLIYSKTIGSLNVYIQSEDGLELLWTLSGVDEDAWQHGIVSFQIDKYHVIVIEGVRGDGNTGDIALDDLTIRRDGSCKIQPDNAKPQYYASSLINCGFEGNTLGNIK